MAAELTVRRKLDRRFTKLWDNTSSWRAHWTMLFENFLPRRSGHLTGGRRKQDKKDDGSRRNNKVINNTPVLAVRVASSGMMAGVTSPSRPWFKLETTNDDLNDDQEVREWTDEVAKRIHTVFSRSNLYTSLPAVYDELLTGGTGCCLVTEDSEEVIRVHTYTLGEYVLATDKTGRTNTFMREYTMTVEQVVDEFGEENCSADVCLKYKTEKWDDVVRIRHAIVPRDTLPQTDKQKGAPKGASVNMDFQSIHWEVDRSETEDKLLRQKGYRRFRILAPRWYLQTGETWGRSPGMDCLGDARQLQDMEKKKARAEALGVDPPMKGPTALQQAYSSTAPGTMTYLNEGQGQNAKYEPVYTPDPRFLQFLFQDIEIVEARINSSLYVDLFLMLASSNRREITAREVEERHEEKLLQLGPVIERLYDELLDPLIDITFEFMLARGLIPDPPPQLEGEELKVELISIMAQAQKLVAASTVERLVGFATSLAQVKPEVLDKLDADEVLASYAELLGTDAVLLLDADEVAEVRQARQQQEQLAQGAAMAEQMAGAVNKAGAAPSPEDSEENFLQFMLNQNPDPGGQPVPPGPDDLVF